VSGAAEAKSAWLERVLGVSLPLPEKVTATAHATAAQSGARPEYPALADIRTRIGDVRIQASTLPEPRRSNLLKRISEAEARLAGEGVNPDMLGTEVGGIESDCITFTREARQAEARTMAGDQVSYRLLQTSWREAQERAGAQLDEFVASVLADPELKGNARYPLVEAAASRIKGMLPKFGDDLETDLAQIDDASSEADRATARAAAVKTVGKYRAELDGASGLKELQALSDDAYGGLSFFSELQGALASLATQLATPR
jgi:hypothetical protein